MAREGQPVQLQPPQPPDPARADLSVPQRMWLTHATGGTVIPESPPAKAADVILLAVKKDRNVAKALSKFYAEHIPGESVPHFIADRVKGVADHVAKA